VHFVIKQLTQRSVAAAIAAVNWSTGLGKSLVFIRIFAVAHGLIHNHEEFCLLNLVQRFHPRGRAQPLNDHLDVVQNDGFP
jgi:hypothetical protein